MTTSGTYAFTLDLGDIMEEAYERVGSELRSGYDYRTARRSLDLLLLEWQNKGLNLWTIKEDSVVLVPGSPAYTLSEEKVDVIEALLRTNAGEAGSQSDLYLNRVSINTYARQTNKLQTGRPLQYWLERSSSGITLNLWPVPDTSETYTLVYYYMCRIEDSGNVASNTSDVPTRFLPALIAGLAYYLALKKPEVADKVPTLKAIYDEQWDLAADASREKASWFMRPAVSR